MNLTDTRTLLYLAPVALLVALIYGAGPGDWFGDDEVSAIEGVPVRRGPLRISELARGNLEAKDSARLVNELEGRTSIIYLIEEGTRVEVGDIVCELDTSGLKDRLVDQAISVDRASANLVNAQEQYGIQEIQNTSDEAEAVLALELAELSLEAYEADEGEWDVELAQANEAIVLAQERFKQAEDTLEWTKKLFEKGFVQKTELDRDELNVTSSQISWDQAVRDRNLKKAYGDRARRKQLQAAVESRRRDLEVVKKQAAARLVDFDSARNSAKREFERQEEKLAKLKDQISKGVIYAPEAGLVVYARTRARMGSDQVPQEGGDVHERQAIATIPRAGGMTADVSLHETKLEMVHVGLSCLVTVDALPGQVFTGHVAAVAAVADSGSWMSNPNQRLYKTEVALDREVTEMRPGMSCGIEILVEDLSDVLFVPVQSVFADGGRQICFVREGSGVEQREVKVGQDNNRNLHVISGLEEGEVVLLSPPASWDPAPQPAEPLVAIPASKGAPAAATTPGATTRPTAGPLAAGTPAHGDGAPGGGSMGRGGGTSEQREAMRKRFDSMSPEEKEKMMERYRSMGAGGQRPGSGDSR